MVGFTVSLSKAFSLAIDGAMLTGRDIAVNFFGLFIW